MALLLVAGGVSLARTPQRVILIQADDLGYDDLGASGNPLARTPHLDRFAAEAVRLEDFTVNPVCAPSRATLLTGRHFLRTGVAHVHGGKDYLDLAETTLAEVLQRAGWQTAMRGSGIWARGPVTSRGNEGLAWPNACSSTGIRMRS